MKKWIVLAAIIAAILGLIFLVKTKGKSTGGTSEKGNAVIKLESVSYAGTQKAVLAIHADGKENKVELVPGVTLNAPLKGGNYHILVASQRYAPPVGGPTVMDFQDNTTLELWKADEKISTFKVDWIKKTTITA